MSRLFHWFVALWVLIALAPLLCHAQSTSTELRADAIFGSVPALQVGGGVQLPAGVYGRIGFTGAVGARVGPSDAASRIGGRLDLLGRFLLDPFRQTPFGVSAGAGLSARFEPGERATPLLLVALDVEGRRSAAGWSPAVQLGLGGGTRVGLVIRRAPRATR